MNINIVDQYHIQSMLNSLSTAKVKVLESEPLKSLEALQLYSPAEDKTRLSSIRTEVMEDVPLNVSVILLVTLSRREPSLYQEMSGSGIPEAEQTNDTVSLMSAVRSTGNSKMEVFSVDREMNHKV